MSRAFCLLLILVSLGPSNGFAGTITFDGCSWDRAGVEIEYFRFSDSATPIEALPVTTNDPLVLAWSAIPDSGNALLLRWEELGFGPHGVLFTFPSDIVAFSAVGNDFGGDPNLDRETVFLSAFAADGRVVLRESFSGPYGVPDLRAAQSAFSAARHVAVTWTGDLNYYALDNVGFIYREITEAPEISPENAVGAGLILICAVLIPRDRRAGKAWQPRTGRSSLR